MTILYNPKTHARHSIRLLEYDYASVGYYFVTICTQDRKRLFGRIRHGGMELSALGKIVSDTWKRTEYIRENIYIDSYIVMPDHLHGIIQITDTQEGVGAGPCPAPVTENADIKGVGPTKEPFPFLNGLCNNPGAGQGPAPTPRSYAGSIPAIVGSFKSESTKTINRLRGTKGIRIWQRNFNDRIIRDQEELDYYRMYIHDNPKR